MAVTIVNYSDTTFTLNGIEYQKNFQSIVTGDNVKVLNVYDGSVVLQINTDYSEYKVNGSSYASASLLQSALVDILFYPIQKKIEGIMSGYQGVLLIADTPLYDGYYMAGESGTFTNAGGLVVDLNNGMAFINVSDTQTVFTQTVIPIVTYEPNNGTFDGADNIVGATQKSTENHLADKVFTPKLNLFTNNGVYINDVFVDSVNWRNGEVLAKEGDIVTYYVYIGNTINPVVFLDINDVVVGSVTGTGANAFSYGQATAPFGTVKAVFSTLESYKETSYYGVTQLLIHENRFISKYGNYQKESNNFNTYGLYINDVWTESSNWSSEFIDIEGYKDVSYSLYGTSNSNLVTFLDINNDIISSTKAPIGQIYSGELTSPTGTKKVVFTTINTELNTSYYTYQSTTSDLNIDLQKTINVIENPIITPINGKIITVSKTETEDVENYIFNTIESALDIALKNDLVYVYEGVYLEQDLLFADGVKMIGVGNVTIQGELPDSSASSPVLNTSTIDMFYSGYLENLTITCKNMRYPIHADFSDGLSTKRIINCRFIHNGNSGVYDYRVINGGSLTDIALAQSAWGGGTESGDKVYIKGCYFKSPVRAFSTHNNTDFNLGFGSSYVEIEDSELISTGVDLDGSNIGFLVSIMIQSLTSNSNECIVSIKNSKVNGFICNLSSSTITLITDSENLRQVWNTAGSAFQFNDEISSLSRLKYHKLTKEMNSYKNLGSVTIPKGSAVKIKSYGVELMTDSDLASDFYGVALQDIIINNSGDVQFKGYLLRPYFEGLLSASVVDGDNIGVDSNGAFLKNNGLIVCNAVDNQNILIK